MGTFGLFFFFGCATQLVGSLVPRPGIAPGPSAVKAWSPDYWTAREFPGVWLVLDLRGTFSPGKAVVCGGWS